MPDSLPDLRSGTQPCDPGLALWRARRLRDEIFHDAGFADPAWDMLLALYNAARARRPVHVADLCAAAQVPQSTALRWMQRLERLGYTRKIRDTRDKRAIIVELTPSAHDRMASFIRRCDFAAPCPAARATIATFAVPAGRLPCRDAAPVD